MRISSILKLLGPTFVALVIIGFIVDYGGRPETPARPALYIKRHVVPPKLMKETPRPLQVSNEPIQATSKPTKVVRVVRRVQRAEESALRPPPMIPASASDNPSAEELRALVEVWLDGMDAFPVDPADLPTAKGRKAFARSTRLFLVDNRMAVYVRVSGAPIDDKANEAIDHYAFLWCQTSLCLNRASKTYPRVDDIFERILELTVVGKLDEEARKALKVLRKECGFSDVVASTAPVSLEMINEFGDF